jgi:mannose-6-phosphate isomerase class I
MTQQQLLWQMWDGKLVPFGQEVPHSKYFWKEYYYTDFYLLHYHKPVAFKNMHYYLDVTDVNQIKLLPKAAFDDIISTLVKYPVKEVKIFQPGPWGAYRYRDLFEVEGLECNAWNELAGPELNILIDIDTDYLINMPVMNLLEHAEEFVGSYIHENLPGMIPYDVWLNDGYHPEPVPQERSSMPIHSHPSTDYVKRHFNEQLGRYETYYIAEAYEGANTMMGFKEGIDMEEWELKCRESWDKQEPIQDWKDYVKIWPSNVGDLYLIPPGTTHGHGGNQMVLEMDTSASPCGTEYSFFTYDFMRPSWDDNTKTMTAKPMKMHLEHGFDNEKWRNEEYVKDNLYVRQPDVIKWTKEYAIDRYKMVKEMPFEIERIHFTVRAEYDTFGKFMHIPTLTVGSHIKIRSLTNPELETELDQWQACMIPAGFGKYECINMGEGACTIVLIRWRKG